MFTGIVEELGHVVSLDRLGTAARLVVRGPVVTADVRHGESISVNGCCLTVVDARDGTFAADVMLETLSRTAIGELTPGDYRITFWIGRVAGFFERISLDVHVEDATRSYHVPLLLAPYAMTTYRGS